MIEELCKKDRFWRIVAYRICKDKSLADDMVQEMYLKLYNCTKQINDFYVIITMKNIFIDSTKKQSLLVPIDNYDFSNENEFLIDDAEKNLIDSLKWYEKELMEMLYDKSLRQIERDLNINYQFVNRILKKSKNKLCQERKKLQLQAVV